MIKYKKQKLENHLIIDTDTEYIEKIIQSCLCLEKPTITSVKTFSEIALSSKLHGVEIICSDGAKYCLTIARSD